MDIRVVVPLKWDSQLRKDLFERLKFLGYTWSSGVDLSSNKNVFNNMKYVAINCVVPVISFSSKIEIVEKPVSQCGFNYMVQTSNIDTIIDTVNNIKEYLKTSPSHEELQEFVTSYYEFKNLVMLL